MFDELQFPEKEVNTITIPRLLVVSGFQPGDQHVGSVLLQQILGLLPTSSFRIVVALPRTESVRRSGDDEVILRRRYESSFRPIGGLPGRGTEYLAHRVLFERHVATLQRSCLGELQAHACEAILVVLDCPTTIALASSLSRCSRLPLLLFVMDSPEHLCRQYGYSGGTTRRLMHHFHHALHKATRIAVAGESMQEAYQTQYGKACTILRQGLPYSVPWNSQWASTGETLTIGFAGSITAPDAFQSLLRGLRERKWQLAGRSVTLRFVGAQLRLDPDGPMNIQYFGWRSVAETIELMATCDVLYLPQPFSQSLRPCAELSFPNKLCTYLPSRRPILLHTPIHGSLNSFFRKYPCGPICNELKSDQLLNQLEQMVLSQSNYQRHLFAVEEAFRSELNLASLHRNVHTFLGNRDFVISPVSQI